jgi:hypothetical protein
MDIQQLRKYRIQISQSFLNSESKGIALFDFTVTFIAAYILETYFKLSNKLPGKNKLQTYYLLVIPLGIIIHHLLAHYQEGIILQFPSEITFLNKHVFTTNFNIYQLILVIMLYIIYTNVSI